MSDSLPYEYVDAKLHERRERVFLVLAGFFLGSMTMLNIVGITRFVHLGPLALAVGVLPYPLTFLCTDFICELYGRRRANFVVWVGLALNVFVLGVMWLGNALPAMSESVRPEWQPAGSWSPPPWQVLSVSEPVILTTGEEVHGRVSLFHIIYACTAGSVLASMCAYSVAQFCDVSLFHFWKRVTRGRYLWVRNNGSTMVSQLIDATLVIFITFRTDLFSGRKTIAALLTLIACNYLFKLIFAALDTIPFYVGVRFLSRYLRIDASREHES